MTGLELLEQDAKDIGLIKSKTEHAFWGTPDTQPELELKGYKAVLKNRKPIDCGDNRLFKIKRSKMPVS